MKKMIFTLMMIAGLALVAGTANAQTNRTPYQGGEYSYRLSDVSVNAAGTAEITMSGNAADWTLSGVADQSGALTVSSGTTYELPASSTELNFNIEFSTTATIEAKTLTVTIVDGNSTGGCSNFINLQVTVTAPPTLELAVAGPASPVCQQTNASPDDNTAASVGQTTTFEFTVTPVITEGVVVAGGTYSFDFSLSTDYDFAGTTITIQRTGGDGTPTPVAAGSATISIAGATNAQTFTVSFATTTGEAPETMTGFIDNAKLQVAASQGGFDVLGTYNTQSFDATIQTMPSIGSFD